MLAPVMLVVIPLWARVWVSVAVVKNWNVARGHVWVWPPLVRVRMRRVWVWAWAWERVLVLVLHDGGNPGDDLIRKFAEIKLPVGVPSRISAVEVVFRDTATDRVVDAAPEASLPMCRLRVGYPTEKLWAGAGACDLLVETPIIWRETSK